MLVASLAIAWPGAALADAGDACVTAYEGGQQLARDRKLVRARAELVLCQRACPTVLVSDCDRWLGDLDGRIPTVLPTVHDAGGNAVADVRVFVDGAPVADRIDGAPLAVDPGEHTFRFERADGAVVETRLTLVEGERGRVVTVTLSADAVTRVDAASGRGTAALALGGVGLAGLAVGAVLGVKGRVDRSSLEDDCAPYCKASDVDAIRTEWWIGGVAAGVGVAALGAAAVLWFTAPSVATAPAARLVVAPTAGGAAAGVHATF